jgi:hypothetical protein
VEFGVLMVLVGLHKGIAKIGKLELCELLHYFGCLLMEIGEKSVKICFFFVLEYTLFVLYLSLTYTL